MADIKDTNVTISNASATTAKAPKAAPSDKTISVGAHFSDKLGLTSVKNKIQSAEAAGEHALSKGIQDIKDIADALLARIGLSSLLENSREEQRKKDAEENKKKDEAAWWTRSEEIGRQRYRELHPAA